MALNSSEMRTCFDGNALSRSQTSAGKVMHHNKLSTTCSSGRQLRGYEVHIMEDIPMVP